MGWLENVIAKHAKSTKSPTLTRIDWFGMNGRLCNSPRDGFLMHQLLGAVAGCSANKVRSWVSLLIRTGVAGCTCVGTENLIQIQTWRGGRSNGQTVCRLKAQTPSQLYLNCRSGYSQRRACNPTIEESRQCKINLLIIATILHFV